MLKRWLLVLSLMFCFGFTLPEPTGYVVDNAGILTANSVSTLNQLCESGKELGQIAVLTLNSTQPNTIEYYSIKLAEKWKVGYKGKDNGVILVVAVHDRKVRIEVGRGVEDKITDAEAGRIIQNVIIPCFKQGDYNAGIVNGVRAIRERITK